MASGCIVGNALLRNGVVFAFSDNHYLKSNSANFAPSNSQTDGKESSKLNQHTVTNIYWSYGDNFEKTDDSSRQYVDMNLHVEKTGLNAGDVVNVTVKYSGGVAKISLTNKEKLHAPSLLTKMETGLPIMSSQRKRLTYLINTNTICVRNQES